MIKAYIKDMRPLNPKYYRMEPDWQNDLLGFDYNGTPSFG